MSDVSGSAASIASLQTDTVHAYQRPDDNVSYNSNRTSLRGDAERISFSKFGGGITHFQSVYQRYSPGFETNDLGCQQHADEQLFRNCFALQFSKPTTVYQRVFFNFNAQERWTTEGLVLGNGVNHNNHIQWKNFMWTRIGFNLNDYVTSFSDRALRVSAGQHAVRGVAAGPQQLPDAVGSGLLVSGAGRRATMMATAGDCARSEMMTRGRAWNAILGHARST